MQSARSLLTRFSGLAFFLLALLVVGLLVFFTVRSANDDEGTVSVDEGMASSETTEQGEAPGAPGTETESESEETDDSAVGSTTDPQEDGNVSAAEDGLPNTGPEEAVIPAAVIGLLVWQVLKWQDSRRHLASALDR